MPESITIDGRSGLVSYVDAQWIPVAPEQATLAIVVFEDGGRGYYTAEPTTPKTLAKKRAQQVWPVHGVADAARPLFRDFFQKAWTTEGVTKATAENIAKADAKRIEEEFASLLQRVLNASAHLHARVWAHPKPMLKAASLLRFLKPAKASIAKPEFDVANSEAINWARSHSTEFISGMLEERRTAVQSIIADGIEKGRTVPQTAKLLRETVGLTARQGEALTALQDTLEEQGLSASDIEDEISVRAQEMTESRAEMIAQTETMAAANEGQKELWDQAVEQGLLTGGESKEWIYTPDGNACGDCEELDGTTVLLSEEFDDGDPPLHPYCRCTLGLAIEAAE